MLGEFDFSDEKLQDTTGVLSPKNQIEITPENWGRQIDDTDAVSIGYRNPMAVLVPLRRKPKLALVVPI